MTSVFKLTGLHCSSCKELIEEAATEVPGVEKANVNLKASVLTIEHGTAFHPESLMQAIVSLGAGYAVTPL